MTPRLAADPVLPGRDELLDAGLVAQRIGATADTAVDEAEILRVKYRIGESIRVAYRIRARGVEQRVAAHAFAGGRAGIEWRRAVRGVVPTALLPPVWLDDELNTVFWSFPNDRKLGSLAALAANGAALVAYAPEKSAIACRDDTFLKLYADETGETTSRVHCELAQATEFDVPAVLDYDARNRLLTIGPAAGTPLGLLAPARAASGFRSLGAALAALHARRAPVWLPAFGRLDVARVGHAAELVARARPDVAGDARGLARMLRRRFEPLAATSLLHGDVHPKNVFVRSGGRITFIDLDGASAGAPEAEVGSVLAGLRYRVVDGSLREDDASALRTAFLDGYRRSGGVVGRGLGWHVAAALLAERALRAVNRVRPRGLAHLPAVLADAHLALAEGSDA